MNSRWIGLALAATLLAVPLALKFGSAGAREVVELEPVALRQIRPTILASGVLVFHQEVRLSSELIGPVAQLMVKEGDRVRRGQPLLRLDQRIYEAEIEQQRSSLRAAGIGVERARLQLAAQRTNLDRNAQLVAKNFIASSKYDEAANQVGLAEVELKASGEALRQAAAQLELSREKLAKTIVRAPIDGTVTSLNIEVGETAVPNSTGLPGTALMTIADDASMRVEVNVDEADIASVAVGQRARVFPSATPDVALDGEIRSIALSPRVAAQGRSYVVKVRLGGSHPELRTGMTARVEIAGGEGTSRPTVPLAAVLADAAAEGRRSAAQAHVFTVADGVARRVKVELGLADITHQEVLAGLRAGEQVVVGPARALRELRDGQAVKAGDEPAPMARQAAGTPQRSTRL